MKRILLSIYAITLLSFAFSFESQAQVLEPDPHAECCIEMGWVWRFTWGAPFLSYECIEWGPCGD